MSFELHETNATFLISGATGMIGSQLVRAIIAGNAERQLGNKVIALYRNQAKRDAVFQDLLNCAEIQWVQGDIGEPVAIDDAVDYIIHTAGVTGGSKKHVEAPIDTIFSAVYGTRNMLDLAKEKQVKGFVFLSTLEVYGKTDFEIPSITEQDYGYLDPMVVRSSYPESKRLCETMCAGYYKQYGVPAKIVRLAPTYGAGASYTDNRVLCEFSRCVIEKKDIVLKSDGSTVRNYCDVYDAVNAIFCVLVNGAPCEAYNIANMGTEISIRELAERFIALYPESGISLKINVAEDIRSLGYNTTVKIRLDSKKLEALGWCPAYDMDQMIRHLVNAMLVAKKQA